MSEPVAFDAGAAAEYVRRLREREREQEAAARRYRALLRQRKIVVGLVVALALLGEKEAASTKAVLLGIPALVVVGLVIAKSRVVTMWWRATVASSPTATPSSMGLPGPCI